MEQTVNKNNNGCAAVIMDKAAGSLRIVEFDPAMAMGVQDMEEWLRENGVLDGDGIACLKDRYEWFFLNSGAVPIFMQRAGLTVGTSGRNYIRLRWHYDYDGYADDIKDAEQRELIEKLIAIYGNPGVTHRFDRGKSRFPIIAAYVFDEPRDFVVKEVRLDDSWHLTLVGYEKEEGYTETEIDADDAFPGQLCYVTDMIETE